MAVVKPFRALRYDEAAAGPLETLVAPPYDVISAEQRLELLERNPRNVVRLTLPDSEEEAAQTLEQWRGDGTLVEEPPAVWALSQEYVGPDGVARRREGIVASLKVEPYTTKTVPRRGNARDGSHDGHRADRHSSVEAAEPHRPADPCAHRCQNGASSEEVFAGSGRPDRISPTRRRAGTARAP